MSGLVVDQRTADRFWAKVDQNGPIPEHAPKLGRCWLWTGALSTGGYGNFWAFGRYMRATHVVLLLKGVVVPEGQHACHHCDNPACVKPRHLFVGTRNDNMRDCHAKGRSGDALLRSETTRGAANVKAKLDERGVRALVDAWNAGGATKAELARRFNVWPSNVQHIIHGRTWKHLGLEIRRST